MPGRGRSRSGRCCGPLCGRAMARPPQASGAKSQLPGPCIAARMARGTRKERDGTRQDWGWGKNGMAVRESRNTMIQTPASNAASHGLPTTGETEGRGGTWEEPGANAGHSNPACRMPPYAARHHPRQTVDPDILHAQGARVHRKRRRTAAFADSCWDPIVAPTSAPTPPRTMVLPPQRTMKGLCKRCVRQHEIERHKNKSCAHAADKCSSSCSQI